MEKTLRKTSHFTMQNGNATNSSDDTPTYPWSSFFSGHPPTIDELPHQPRLTLYTSTTNSDEENLTRTTLLIFLTDLPPKLPKRSQSTPRWKKPRTEARKLLTYLYELAEMATHD